MLRAGALCALAGCVVAFGARRVHADDPIAVVDIQGVILRTPALLQIEDGSAAARELERLAETLSALRERLRAPAPDASADAARALQERYDRLSNEYQRKQVDYRRDLDTAQTEAAERARAAVARVAARLARQRGIRVVIDRDALIYREGDQPLIDLTDAVAEALGRPNGPPPRTEPPTAPPTSGSDPPPSTPAREAPREPRVGSASAPAQ